MTTSPEAIEPAALARVAARVRELARGYEPPSFAHVPDLDAAIFLCAVDHRTGYRRGHTIDGRGPFAGSELMWELGLRAARRLPGLLTAPSLVEIEGGQVADAFRVDDETVADPERRARLWRELARGLVDRYVGSAAEVLTAADGRLGGAGGLIGRLAACRGLR